MTCLKLRLYVAYVVPMGILKYFLTFDFKNGIFEAWTI